MEIMESKVRASLSQDSDDPMPENANLLFEAAMHLPEGQRLSLVSRILDTMPAGDVACSVDDPDLLDELERRFAEPEGAIPWSELRAEI